MAVWLSTVRPILFSVIRNNSQRKIHYCDYLLGLDPYVELYARKSPASNWVVVPSKVMRKYGIGVLLCGSHDTLYPGEIMKPRRTASGHEIFKSNYTVAIDLEDYEIPDEWHGTIEFKMIQTLFGGDHKDSCKGKIESASFSLKLPLKRRVVAL